MAPAAGLAYSDCLHLFTDSDGQGRGWTKRGGLLKSWEESEAEGRVVVLVQKEREQEVARLMEERHQARELKRKEEYVKQCRLDLEKRRLEVHSFPLFGPLTEHPKLRSPWYRWKGKRVSGSGVHPTSRHYSHHEQALPSPTPCAGKEQRHPVT